MSDMTTAETALLTERLDKIDRNLERLTARVDSLPDKAAIYSASLAIHGVVWASILGTIAALAALGAFG